MRQGICLAIVGVVIAAPVWSQSLRTEDNVETEGQLVSKVGQGTPPLEVSSTTKVENLNADSLDGFTALAFAFYSELLLANPDPPCFDMTHRFVNCGNGTVTDTVSGLIWLYDASCFGDQDWPTANQSAAGLATGSCGLSDGSRVGDWRLPTKEEWVGIMNTDCPTDPEIVGNQSPVPGCYADATDLGSEWASGVEADFYWSSTTRSTDTESAWHPHLGDGIVGIGAGKFNTFYVWPVRDF
jgi:hypothetical protein